jgi:hypothetical protein
MKSIELFMLVYIHVGIHRCKAKGPQAPVERDREPGGQNRRRR